MVSSSSNTFQHVQQMFTIHKNCHDMLIDRQYDDLLSGYYPQTLEEFVETYVKYGSLDKEMMGFVRGKNDGSATSLISVYFMMEESIGIKHIVGISEKMINSKITHCILVYPYNITSSAKKYMEKTSKLRIEAFAEHELMVNITKHVLTPKHQVLTTAEKKEFLLTNRLQGSQLAKIHVTDPVARYYGMKRGDLVRIVRRSDAAGRYATFRLCV